MKPPPVLSGAMVVAYASVDSSIKFSDDGLLVDGKPLGRVPQLAIARSGREVLLLHCSRAWKVLGTSVHASASEAERSAERSYPGISRKWQRMRISRRQSEAFLKALWKDQECSFCQRRPDQVEKIVAGRGVRICDICIKEIRTRMSDESS